MTTEKSLFEQIKDAKRGNDEAFIAVIEKFRPTIKKFSRQLGYEEAETDLIIELIQVIKRTIFADLKKKYDGAIVNYIYHAMDNRKINLFKKYVQGKKTEVELNLDIIADQSHYEIEDVLLIKKALNDLPILQKNILKEKLIYGYADIEIAKKYQISRQAVNKTKNTTLKNLKKALKTQCFSIA
ncbi:sigma-70 family RNA polymerase sigma factor [Anaerophilus nitritogenes]|uniref:sigma-70 family RNA polymerase sigma factor n=1 Tax=Anaerophilus nitritogenes TaxID=2498136 RepID=UPI00101D891C|nr:sigma-70 family RNA polymerase sigma factor [Anaerophilus nitritogenes]